MFLQLAEALPGLHDFTGYDYGPAFSGRGKSRPLKLLQKCEDVPKSFGSLKAGEISDENIQLLEGFACKSLSQIKRLKAA